MRSFCKSYLILALALTSVIINESQGSPTPIHPRHPVILVPGDGGSQLEGRLNKTSTVHYLCAKQSSWYNIWLTLSQMVPPIIDCWVDNIRLIYDPKTHKTHNSPGVEIRVPGFGNSSSTVEYLDPWAQTATSYFAPIAKRLVELGYQRGIDLHGAPYDFRKAANEHASYFVDLKALIESTYARNNNQPVIIVAHSMGSIMSLYFLNNQSQQWKEKHVRGFITLSAVWAGTVRAMKVFAMGDNLGAFIVKQSSLMIEQRTNPSLSWLMPSSKLWNDTEILVQSPQANLTVNDLDKFYDALNRSDLIQMRMDVKNLVYDLKAPQVELHCLHGSQVPTTERLVYNSFPDSTPTLIKGDGDGTVNMRSLVAFMRWVEDDLQRNKGIYHHLFPKVNHLQILKDKDAVQIVRDTVHNMNSKLGGHLGMLKNSGKEKEEKAKEIKKFVHYKHNNNNNINNNNNNNNNVDNNVLDRSNGNNNNNVDSGYFFGNDLNDFYDDMYYNEESRYNDNDNREVLEKMKDGDEVVKDSQRPIVELLP